MTVEVDQSFAGNWIANPAPRPAHLIIVTHPGHAGVELFSAHHTAADAEIMRARLERLLTPAGSHVHLIAVPEAEGVADLGELPPLPPAPKQAAAAPAAPAPPAPPAEKPKPFRRLSQEQFEVETRAMIEAEANGIIVDTPMPVYAGAMS